MMRAHDVYVGSDGEVTKRYYAHLGSFGLQGALAVNLFRAQKCSARAKLYRGGKSSQGRWRDLAYDRKNWSMRNLTELLNEHAQTLGIKWGWKCDPRQAFHSWVLYVDLPNGQVSFHAGERMKGPDYKGEWDGRHLSCERILAFCESVTAAKEERQRA